jgi:hypothetical protein
MTTLSYCKGLPTPESEMNSLGFTQLEMFLAEVSPIFHSACCETVTHLLADQKFNKSQWNAYLQQRYGIAKRHAAGVISFAKGAVDSAKECRIEHIKFSQMYGLASDESAALAIARRGMRLSEKIPHSVTAYLEVNSEKHVWSGWHKLNKLLKLSRVNRHQFYSIANGESLVNLLRKEVGNDA